MDKTPLLQSARDEYWRAHERFLAARMALRTHPENSVLKARYQSMLHAVSTTSAKLAALEIEALRNTLDSLDEPASANRIDGMQPQESWSAPADRYARAGGGIAGQAPFRLAP
jgi:hypothetical protein